MSECNQMSSKHPDSRWSCSRLNRSEIQVAYCTNVHAGTTIRQVMDQLSVHSSKVKGLVSPDQVLGIGLWLSATAVDELDDPRALNEFRDWLQERGLLPFTFNGFPYGDFHQERVRHDVYLPTWADPERCDYTIRLANIQNALLPDTIQGTISTLPLAWPMNRSSEAEVFQQSAEQIRSVADHLHQIMERSGREIVLCIEPEPGCLLDTAGDVVHFFNQSLMTGDSSRDDLIRRHIGVCHDICHSAVMFESQLDALTTYQDAGIRVGKIQVSSAIELDFSGGSEDVQRYEQLKLLSREKRYLHQTMVVHGHRKTFFEDVDLAISSLDGPPQGIWRIHFHVPIYCEKIESIGTTNCEINTMLELFQSGKLTPPQHFEVETYAWNVLPKSWSMPPLAQGIADELRWFNSLLDPDENESGNEPK